MPGIPGLVEAPMKRGAFFAAVQPRAKCVSDPQYSCLQCNVRTFESIGITNAVDVLMMLSDGVEPAIREPPDPLHQPYPLRRMKVDLVALLIAWPIHARKH